MADVSTECLKKEIADILKDADLSIYTVKKVRQELEKKLQVNLDSRRLEIDNIVMGIVSPKVANFENVKKTKGFIKKLSPELAALVGQDTMHLREIVKRVWSYIKEKNLFDPANRQYTICDDALKKVIGVRRFRSFTMLKYIKNHFY